MAEMIDTAKAKDILGCDDATLNGYINNGSIRAQRKDGKQMVMAEDVEKLARDDGTIVITGDSADLQIDLGKVADDAQKKKEGTQSITFGDDLEVVSFDDAGTADLKGGKPATRPAKSKSKSGSFTDANTEVMSAIDEPQVDDGTEVTHATTQDRGANPSATASARRSVRSSRVHVDMPKIHPIWAIVMAATFLVGAGGVVPYYFISKIPRGTDAKGNVLRGVDDSFMANFAAIPAGFSVDPDAKKHKGDGYTNISDIDKQAEWRNERFLKYNQKTLSLPERIKSFTVEKVDLGDDQVPTQATNALGDTYKVNAQKGTTAAGDHQEFKVDMSVGPASTGGPVSEDKKPIEEPADKPAEVPAAPPADPQ